MTRKTKKRSALLMSAAAGLMVVAGGAGIVSAEEGKVHCYGVNKCKGTGACGGKGHSCAGQNECKGKGYLNLDKEECLSMEDGRLTPEPKG